MIWYPKIYLKNVVELSDKIIEKNHIKAIILDVDNTLIDYEQNMLEGVEAWCKKQKQNGIKFCILSNSNKKEKVKKVAQILDVPYIYFAKKPLKFGFKKAIKMLGVKKEQIAVVGDQIFTDVIGANRSKMISVLVEPIKEKDIWITVLKRPLEQRIIHRYLKKIREEKK